MHLVHLVDMEVFGSKSDLMILGVFSSLIDSVIQWLYPQMGHRITNDIYVNF